MNYSKTELPRKRGEEESLDSLTTELPLTEEKVKKRTETSSQIIGWILLIAGVILIGWTLMSSYNIFTAKTGLPEFFETPREEVITQKEGIQDIQAQMEQMITEQLKGVLPADSITKLFNLIVWSILAFILIFGGSQISSLGIKLIKNRVPQ